VSDTLKLPRLDIQALRGLAVLMVVLYHTKMGALQSGYLGVDVFFVISGFLITTLVATGIQRGSFRLSEFYFRRAKRLLPAAYVTFFVTALFAPWFLNRQELHDFSVQMFGAITFTGNMVLWQQTGYFEGASDLKPLLHVWSLAIEEQYYFLLPTVLLFIRPTRWLTGAMVVVLISLALCIAGGQTKPVATFYLLPTRAWELLIGSVGALWALRASDERLRAIGAIIRHLFVPSVACLLVLPFLPAVGVHPGANALLVCLATLVVILQNSPWLNAAAPTKVLAHIGDFSYSLYLVHWPIIALIKNAWLGNDPELPFYLRFSALLLSFGAAYLLYRVVEDPIRRRSFHMSTPLVAKVMLTSALLVFITPLMMLNTSATQLTLKDARAINPGFSLKCDFNSTFKPMAECMSKPSPQVLVWGDSYAMHLVPGMAQELSTQGVLQATMSGCGPVLGIAPRRKVNGDLDSRDQAWAERCIAFNQSVLDFLGTTATINTVVLSSPFSAYFDDKAYDHVLVEGQSYKLQAVSAIAPLAGLRRTVEKIRASGKKVVLVAPPPSSGFDIGSCLERQLGGQLLLGRKKGCMVDKAEYERKQIDVLKFLNAMPSAANLAVISFDPWLCNGDTCETLQGQTPLYRDAGHLSISGSKLLAYRMKLKELIYEQAK
jgi:peptidoglycan/LPS O-acetylase OafA/YrhL